MKMPLGYLLLRDPRVPMRAKLMALGAGAAVITAIELLQIPFETIAAALLPFVGIPGDLALDGAEAIIGPILVACLLLPRLTPVDIVRRIRAEAEYRSPA
jgi:hypothetical protein